MGRNQPGGSASTRLDLFIGGVVALWPALAIVDGHYGLLVLYLLTALGLVELVRAGWRRVDATGRTLLFMVAAAYLAGLAALAGSAEPAEGWRHFDSIYSRLLAIVPVFFLFQQRPVPVGALWWGGAFGAIAAGLVALHQLHTTLGSAWLSPAFFQGGIFFRADGGSHPVIFGMVSATASIFALAGLAYFRRFGLRGLLFWGGAVALGLFACLLTGSRGAWLGVVAAVLAAIVMQVRSAPRLRTKLLAAGAGALGLALLASVPYVQQRMDAAVEEVGDYLEGAEVGTSLGLRFEMWRAVGLIAAESPIIGAGYGDAGYPAAIQRLVEEQRVDPRIGPLRHAHNELLHVLATRGVLGVATVFALLLYLPVLFHRVAVSAGQPVRQVAIAGLMISIAYLVFGLSDVPSQHRATSVPFALLMGSLLGSSYRRQPAPAADAEKAATITTQLVSEHSRP